MKELSLKKSGVTLLILFTAASWFLALSGNTSGLELGAIFNFVYPLIAGAISIILFLVVCLITKDRSLRILIWAVFGVYLMYVGFIFRFSPGYLPFPL